MGDTTDGDDSDVDPASAPQTPRQKSVLNRPSSAPGSKAASPRPFQRTAIGPTRGIFIHENSGEAIAVTNRTTKALTFYRPRTSISFPQPQYTSHSSSSANNSPRAPLQQFNPSDHEFGDDVFRANFFNSDIMLTGLFGGAGTAAPSNAWPYVGSSVGPPEAFYPFVSVGQDGLIVTEDDYEDDEDFGDDVNLNDFMDFGGSSEVDEATDIEEHETDAAPATPATSRTMFPSSTPAQPSGAAETPSSARNTSNAMLDHLDRAGVTAFRNNQNRFRDIACLPHDPDLRASVSRPIRSGRSADTIMSPLRKRSSTLKKQHGSSPFAGVRKTTGRLQSSLMN